MNTFSYFLDLPKEVQLHILNFVPLSVVITFLTIPSLVPLVLARIPNDKLTIKGAKDLSFDDVGRLIGSHQYEGEDDIKVNSLNDPIFYNSYPYTVLHDFCRINRLKPIDTLEISFNKDLDNSSPPLENEVHAFWHDFNKWKVQFNKYQWSIPIEDKSITFPREKLQLLKEISCNRSYVSTPGFSIDQVNFLHDVSSVAIDDASISHTVNVDGPIFEVLEELNQMENIIWNERSSISSNTKRLRIECDKRHRQLGFNYHHGSEIFDLLDQIPNLTHLHTSFPVDLHTFQNIERLTLANYSNPHGTYAFPELLNLTSLTLCDSQFKAVELSSLLGLTYLSIDWYSKVDHVLGLSKGIRTLKLSSRFPTTLGDGRIETAICFAELTNFHMSSFSGSITISSPINLKNVTTLQVSMEYISPFFNTIKQENIRLRTPDFSNEIHDGIKNLKIVNGLMSGELPTNLSRLKLTNVKFASSFKIKYNLRSLVLERCTYADDFTLNTEENCNLKELSIYSLDTDVPRKLLKHIKDLDVFKCFVDTQNHLTRQRLITESDQRGRSRNNITGRGSISNSFTYSNERFALVTNKTSIFHRIFKKTGRSSHGFDYEQFKSDCSTLGCYSLMPEDVYLVKSSGHLEIFREKFCASELPMLYQVIMPDDCTI